MKIPNEGNEMADNWQYDPDKLYGTGARMSGETRNKLLALSRAESASQNRFVSESEMVRLLIERAEEPTPRTRKRARGYSVQAAA